MHNDELASSSRLRAARAAIVATAWIWCGVLALGAVGKAADPLDAYEAVAALAPHPHQGIARAVVASAAGVEALLAWTLIRTTRPLIRDGPDSGLRADSAVQTGVGVVDARALGAALAFFAVAAAGLLVLRMQGFGSMVCGCLGPWFRTSVDSALLRNGVILVEGGAVLAWHRLEMRRVDARGGY